MQIWLWKSLDFAFLNPSKPFPLKNKLDKKIRSPAKLILKKALDFVLIFSSYRFHFSHNFHYSQTS